VQQQAAAITAFRNLFKTSKNPRSGIRSQGNPAVLSNTQKNPQREYIYADLLYKENDIILRWNFGHLFNKILESFSLCYSQSLLMAALK
jgi:hypothetical protein